jgi:hypothetical protein
MEPMSAIAERYRRSAAFGPGVEVFGPEVDCLPTRPCKTDCSELLLDSSDHSDS